MPDTFPAGWVVWWVGGWGQVDIKDHLSPAKLELGLSLAIGLYFQKPKMIVYIDKSQKCFETDPNQKVAPNGPKSAKKVPNEPN